MSDKVENAKEKFTSIQAHWKIYIRSSMSFRCYVLTTHAVEDACLCAHVPQSVESTNRRECRPGVLALRQEGSVCTPVAMAPKRIAKVGIKCSKLGRRALIGVGLSTSG